VRQAEKIVEVFGNVGVPVIVAGDLNAYPNSEPLKVFKKEWGSATGGKAIATFPAPKPVNQIDYILFKPKGSFSVQQVKVLDEPVASDHRPILAVLEVAGQ
jgi:endonuclease/exonuclease/phosphatase family metal-dependent hydrolase